MKFPNAHHQCAPRWQQGPSWVAIKRFETVPSGANVAVEGHTHLLCGPLPNMWKGGTCICGSVSFPVPSIDCQVGRSRSIPIWPASSRVEAGSPHEACKLWLKTKKGAIPIANQVWCANNGKEGEDSQSHPHPSQYGSEVAASAGN